MALTPYQKYQQQSVMTMTQGEMLIKLFDEIIKQLYAAKQFNLEKDYGAANSAVQKAQKILRYLDSTLDSRYEISSNLSALYEYFIHCLTQANLRKENAPIEEILPMIDELRESFVQADHTTRRG
nr:flagellar export chaperone FliS [Ruthenibacterium lactatiformans]